MSMEFNNVLYFIIDKLTDNNIIIDLTCHKIKSSFHNEDVFEHFDSKIEHNIKVSEVNITWNVRYEKYHKTSTQERVHRCA